MSKLKIYRASAGSGKTYTLALEYIKELLLSSVRNAHRHILAVTFTKDATGEMKERILAELYGLAFACNDSAGFMESVQKELKKNNRLMSESAIRDKANRILQDILHDYSRLYITTIDSFFQKVLRNLARELGKGSKFNLEMNSNKVLADAVKAMIENANEKPQVLDWLTTYIEDKLDEGTNWRIDKEILSFSQCIFKEHFQEHEFELKRQLDDNPKIFEQIRESQFKMRKKYISQFKNAWKEISRIMHEQSLSPADFKLNGTVLNLFQRLSEEDFERVSIGKTVVECVENSEKWPAAKSKRKNDVIRLAEINFIPLLEQVLDVYGKYNTSRMITRNLHQLGLIWDITGEISSQNAENNRFMLADTALFLNKMIDDSDASFVYEKIGTEINHVMIDEFQDTSRLQWKNFKHLLSNILANNYFSLIVGDVKQSIYRWRNGDWSILNGIEKELGVVPDTLRFNYRSEKEIVNFNNRFFLKAADLLDAKYGEEFGSDSPFRNAYHETALVQNCPKEEIRGYISVQFLPGKPEEGTYSELVLEQLVEHLKKLSKAGIPPGQICILTRTNKNIIGIAEHFATIREDNPDLAAKHYLNIVSDEAFRLSSSPAIRIIIEGLRVLVDPSNPVPRVQLEYFLNQFALDIERIGKLPGDELIRMPLFELVGHLFRYFQLDRIEGQSDYMFTFYDSIINYLKDAPADPDAFLKFWDEELNLKSVPFGSSIEGIRAMTIHKSKGLQFHTVLIPFCDWNLYPEKNPIVWCDAKEGFYDLKLLPVQYSKKMEKTIFLKEYEKETGQSWMDSLNLLYVAFTRAEHNLLILAKSKKENIPLEKIKTVSDLLFCAVPGMEGFEEEEDALFTNGELKYNVSESKESSNNLFRQPSLPTEVYFNSIDFQPDKTVFKQSNQSREFISGPPPVAEYIARGNIMHALFAKIKTRQDVRYAVESAYSEGLIGFYEMETYAESIMNAIDDSRVSDWFSDRYEIHNECAVIVNENGEITTKRPDRVLIAPDETIIIDYKFGKPHFSHHKQMKEYADLLKQMNYPGIKTFLWYIGENKIVRCI
jgi:ATP-dependent exoDNAse (exonuclease V) beta subunit (contains helicase and exonuclease domains)